MRTLKKIKTTKDFMLDCFFHDGRITKVDLKPFLKSEAFKPLNDPKIFSSVKNKKYFVEWEAQEVDLSADTLYHLPSISI